MKLKQQPEDFRVEELTDVGPADAGPFAFYRLTRAAGPPPTPSPPCAAAGRSTAAPVLRRPQGPPRRHHPVPDHPQRPARSTTTRAASRVTYLGRLGRAVHVRAHPGQPLRGHPARACRAADAERHERPLPEVGRRRGAELLRRPAVRHRVRRRRRVRRPARWCCGHFEEALRLALAAPYEHDRAEAKKREGDPRRPLGRLGRGQGRAAARPRPQPRRLPASTTRPTSGGPCARLRPELRGLYLSA